MTSPLCLWFVCRPLQLYLEGKYITFLLSHIKKKIFLVFLHLESKGKIPWGWSVSWVSESMMVREAGKDLGPLGAELWSLTHSPAWVRLGLWAGGPPHMGRWWLLGTGVAVLG